MNNPLTVHSLENREIFIEREDNTSFREFLLNYTCNDNIKLFTEDENSLKIRIEQDKPYAAVVKALQGLTTGHKLLTSFLKSAGKIGMGSTENPGQEPWLPWYTNIPAFKTVGNFSVSLTFKFTIGQFGLWDGKEEVLKPILNLASIFMPAENNGNIVPLYETSVNLLWNTLATVGSTASTIFKETERDMEEAEGLGKIDALVSGMSEGLNSVIMDTLKKGSNYRYTITTGRNLFSYENMWPVGCTIDTSNTQFDDKGFPAFGKIQVEFSSAQPYFNNSLTQISSENTSTGSTPNIRFGAIGMDNN